MHETIMQHVARKRMLLHEVAPHGARVAECCRGLGRARGPMSLLPCLGYGRDERMAIAELALAKVGSSG